MFRGDEDQVTLLLEVNVFGARSLLSHTDSLVYQQRGPQRGPQQRQQLASLQQQERRLILGVRGDQ